MYSCAEPMMAADCYATLLYARHTGWNEALHAHAQRQPP